jgi:hypothetical protein
MATTAPLLNVDAKDSQHNSGSRVFKLSVVLLGGSCLVLMAMFAYGPGTATEQATSLIAMPTSLRTPSQMTPQALAKKLPGAGPWKELALAGIQDANRCSRDVSMNANSLKTVLSGMDAKDKARVRMLVKAEQDKEAILNIPENPEDVLKAGALPPLGYWDPLGFSTNLPTGRLLFYREVELKHGRICMLASLGILVAEQFHPLFGGDIDVPAYIAWQAIPIQAFWVAVSAAIAIPEVGYSIPTFNTPVDEGDYIDGFTFTKNGSHPRRHWL